MKRLKEIRRCLLVLGFAFCFVFTLSASGVAAPKWRPQPKKEPKLENQLEDLVKGILEAEERVGYGGGGRVILQGMTVPLEAKAPLTDSIPGDMHAFVILCIGTTGTLTIAVKDNFEVGDKGDMLGALAIPIDFEGNVGAPKWGIADSSLINLTLTIPVYTPGGMVILLFGYLGESTNAGGSTPYEYSITLSYQ